MGDDNNDDDNDNMTKVGLRDDSRRVVAKYGLQICTNVAPSSFIYEAYQHPLVVLYTSYIELLSFILYSFKRK